MERKLSAEPTLRSALTPRSCLIVSACLASLSQAASAQDSTRPLASGHPVQDVITTENQHAYTLNLAAGGFVRLVGTATGAALLRLIGPRGDTIQHTYFGWPAPVPLILSHVVAATGLHRLEVVRAPGDTSTVRYDLSVDELLSPARYAARLDSLRTDPRVRWLAQHVLPLRSLSLEDHFADLQPLRQRIGDARIVLLGEESHASGTTIRAMSRLVKFLHQEMGFDVLAFESSLFGMWQVGELLRAGHDPVDAVRQGVIGTWSQSPDFEPLARYLGAHAVGLHPIEVAGVDSRFEPLSKERLIPGLHEAAIGVGLGVEGRDVGLGFWPTLSGFMAGRYFHPDSLPVRRAQEDVVSDLRWLAERLADSSTTRSSDGARTLRLWAQTSRSLAELMVNVWREARGERVTGDRRDQQMARNLIWLAREHFPGRKIIVWAHNVHVLRHTYRFYSSVVDCDCGMGQRIWETFGEDSFVIAATAYSGQFMWRGFPSSWPDLTVVTDQDAHFELEELLAASGLQDGVLILRNPSPGGDWLRAPMLSRIPSNYWTMPGIWPDHADAVLFLRTITPRRTIPSER